jgi:hypothetical protein
MKICNSTNSNNFIVIVSTIYYSGVMRSGDIHCCVQHDFVFSGQVCVWLLQADGSTQKIMYTNHDYIHIPAYTPHVFEFVTDTIMAEWWDGPFHAWYYEPYRNIVQASFIASSTTRAGSLSIYKLVPPPMDSLSPTSVQESILSLFHNQDPVLLFTWTGCVMAIGLSLGYILGRRR